jgi:cytochrome c oxidase subunit 2
VVAPTAETVVGSLPQAAPVAKGDPAAGKQVYAANGCAGCHTFKPAGSTGKVGPDLDNLAADAQKANQGSLDQYTAESITNPGSYVVPGFPNGVMPAFTSLSDTQLADLVAFLTQKS